MSLVMLLVFALTAALYSTVGFAGGSTYLALLAVWQVPYNIIPTVALACNIIVACANSIRYLKAGLFRARLLVPHAALALPMAYIGGRTAIGRQVFEWLVAAGLLCASLQLLIRHKHYAGLAHYKAPSLAVSLPMGGLLGFLSGLIGIGGGIFLSPLLYLLKAGSPREIASTCTFFILLNSLAGLAGQLHKQAVTGEASAYWPLLLFVLAGGLVGNFLTLRLLTLRQIALLTAAALLLIDARLIWTLISASF